MTSNDGLPSCGLAKGSACSSAPLPWEQDHGGIAASLKANNGLHLGWLSK